MTLTQARTLTTGESVDVEPCRADRDYYPDLHDFRGAFEGIRNGQVQVKDQDGNVFELEPESVKLSA